MSWELPLAMATTAGVVVLALLYARAASKASKAEGYLALAEWQRKRLEQAKAVVVAKEDYIRALEKTVVGKLSPGELADRLNGLFAAEGRRAPSAVPTTVPAPSSSDSPLRTLRRKPVP